MYVCLCRGLTEQDVHRAARAGHVTAEALTRELGLDDPRCCGRCLRNIDQYVALARGERCQLRPLPVLRINRRLVPQGA